MKKLIALFFIIFVSGCSVLPESITTAEDTNLVTYQMVKKDLTNHHGKKARWGGIIANIENKADVTVIEIVNLTLSYQARPKDVENSDGRFLAYYQGFLDPVIYKKGRQVTVLGDVLAPIEGEIGEKKYLYPVLKVDGFHLWKKVEKVDLRLRSDFSNNYWHNYPYYPRQPIIVIQKPATQSKK